ncbi:MAG: lysine--tRNA ligase [Phycisphaerales bacterium]|jgi:lysyl-tRNA synthetase class 2|nr:lysine--tRNA ligase [Phycisphaerales bacterium]
MAVTNSTDRTESDLVAARRAKLARWREDLGLKPFGGRVDGLIPLAQARAAFDAGAADAMDAETPPAEDPRPRAIVAGRVVQHRAMGKLCFMVLRDESGDLQISCSKADLEQAMFKLASKVDYGDIVVASGPIGRTKRGEICVWADRFEVHCKSLAPPPEKFHGLTDAEQRYRRRYVDMYMNPETMETFHRRSEIVSAIRRFMEDRGFLEVETPMMQPVAGGAAARPFTTHHNALDIELFLRIAPELYLKRLLVGGMRKVFEINRNFRNEGIDRRHNPEFTMMEAYQAFGDCESVLELTESLIRSLAGGVVAWDGLEIDYGRPFDRVTYTELFQRTHGCDVSDEAAVRALAVSKNLEEAATRDHWLLVEAMFDEAEDAIDPARPTFVTDFPAPLSPLSRPREDDPNFAWRAELFVAGMELGNFYTELNDPDVQRQRFTEQLAGINDEEAAFRTLDEDFLEALHVGMPPAGGMGIGIDRIVMLMTGERSIRDVVLFPLLKPEQGDAP